MKTKFMTGFFIGVILGLAAAAIFLGIRSAANFYETIKALSTLVVAFSAITAYRIYRANVERHQIEDRRTQSDKYLSEATGLLERAYEVFISQGSDPPKNDRLHWLTTARMLLRYNSMKSRITEEAHLAIVTEHEEYARAKFYSLLDACKDKLVPEYFLPDGELYGPESVDRTAAVVIFDFSSWRGDSEDPIGKVDEVQLLAQGAVSSNFRGVQSYLSKYDELQKKVAERRQTLKSNIA